MMVAELILIGLVILVLFGLIALTDKRLVQREKWVKIDERMTDHRSRL